MTRLWISYVLCLSRIKATATNIWNGIKSAIIDPIKSAYDRVLGWIQDIKNAFSNMKISIPKPKLPHITVKKAITTIGGVSVPYPDFDISWYAKGGLFNGPSVIGVAEAGPEAVIPLSGPRMKPFAQTIASQMSKKQDDSGEDQQSTVVFQIQNMNVNDERHAEVMGRRMAKDMSYFMRSGGMRYGL